MRATTDHIGRYHNGEVAGGHLVPLLQLADLVEEPEQVLDVPVVLHRQAVVLQEVPHQVLPLLAVLNPARLQPVGVELCPEERLGEHRKVYLPVPRRQSEEPLLLQAEADEAADAELERPGDAAGEVEVGEVGGEA